MKVHPRAEEFTELIRRQDRLLRAWTGVMYRFQTVKFPTPEEILSGEGARRTGARWNPRGIRTLYGSTADDVALEECKAMESYYGVPSVSPRLLVAIRVDVKRMLNLTAPKVRNALGLHVSDWIGEDWHRAIDKDTECLSQAIGRAAFEAKASGIVVRSVAVPRGVNVVIFPQNLTYFEHVRVIEGELLRKMRGSEKND
jgi:RES domain-containing protein